MLNLSRYRAQKVELLKKNQPDLYATLVHMFPGASEELIGKMAGLHIEYVIQSGGKPEIFGADIDLELDEDDDF